MPDTSINSQYVTEDIIGREPPWLLRSGISTIATIVVALFLLTLFIQYPDSVEAPVTIQTSESTVKHRASTDGVIQHIFVDDGKDVYQGQPLVRFESAVNDVNLERVVQALGSDPSPLDPDALSDNFRHLGQPQHLGEFQDGFNQIRALLDTWARLNEQKLLQLNIQRVDTLSKKYHQLITELERKQQYVRRRLDLAASDVAAQQKLADKGLLIAGDLAAAQQRYLMTQSELSDNQVNIELNKVTLSELSLQLSEQKMLQEQEITDTLQAIEQARSTFLNHVFRWQSAHILYAKIDGKVSFSRALQIHQNIDKNQLLLSVVPQHYEMEAWMKIPAHGMGKLHTGQKVHIELDSFSASEYGVVEGQVDSFSPIPDEDGHLVRLAFPNALATSYGKPLQDVPYLTGTASIVFSSRSLFNRLVTNMLGGKSSR